MSHVSGVRTDQPQRTAPLESLAHYRLLPVAEVQSVAAAMDLVDALTAGDLPIIELTLRTAAGLAGITEITRVRPRVLVAAGTVLSSAQAAAAIDAGAAIVITPGLDPEIVQLCETRGRLVIPGVCTPTEIQHALRLGLNTLKLFPAQAIGGTATLRALSGPFPDVQFIPTGGVGLHNLSDYLDASNVLACGSSELADARHLAAGDFVSIEHAAKSARSIVDSKL